MTQGVQIRWDTVDPLVLPFEWHRLSADQKRQEWAGMSIARRESLFAALTPPQRVQLQDTLTYFQREEWTPWEGAAHLIDVAVMIEDAEAMFRREIPIADHRNCQGGDFDLCWCKTNPAAAERQLAYVERLERGLGAVHSIRATITRLRERAQRTDEVLAYRRAHPEAYECPLD
jgi:hypothetical protein